MSARIEFFPNWEEFPAKDLLETIEEQQESVWKKFQWLLNTVKERGYAFASNCVKRYSGEIIELKLGGAKDPVRVFLSPAAEGGFWVIWACKKNQQTLPQRDHFHVQKRAKSAKETPLR